MSENKQQKGPAGNSTDPGTGKSAATLTVIGTIIVMLALFILYRAERVGNREYYAKSADIIDPLKDSGEKGMVKFSGIPDGELLDEALTGKKYIYLKRTEYRFEKVKKTKTNFVTRNGETKSVTNTYFENDWNYKSNRVQKAGKVKVGQVKIRMDEAEFMGTGRNNKIIYITRSGKSEVPPSNPVVGDMKINISGIDVEQPVFAVGYLQDGYLGSGKLFLISAFSEGKTIEELHETKWIRGPFSFFLLFTGFVFLIYPAMVIVRKNQDLPVLRLLSKIGWILFIIIGLAASYLIVKFSHVTVDLLWIILITIIAVPVYNVLNKKSM